MQFKKGLFIFRRDLRLDDNTALMRALEECESVIACFIFDPRQIDKNEYRSDNCVQFMIESLKDLEAQLEKKGDKLYMFYEKAEELVERLVKEEKIDAVYINRDYTPFSKRRDAMIKKAATKGKAAFVMCDDYLLIPPEQGVKSDGGPYTVYTPFFKNAKKFDVSKPTQNRRKNYYTKSIKQEDKKVYRKALKKENDKLYVRGGRKNALKILKKISKFKDYEKRREKLAEQTTGLSAHHKFGTVSIRETYHAVKEALGEKHALIGELYWRDFFTHIAFWFPEVFGQSFRKKYDKIKWENDKKKFKAWCEGKTGFPVVDAGMRQLNTTGYMHNRVRMIVASFLTKDLHIDWRWGEKYFAQKLVDYDPAVNNGNWQWAASTGCDAQPYFRIFNPWTQQEKFDPKGKYIKKWIGELKGCEPKEIHRPEREPIEGYPTPMVNHKAERERALKEYKRVA